MSRPESAEDFYARVAAATDEEGRLPVGVEDGMPGWDIYPYEAASLRLKPLQPLADAEPPRRGEDPAQCWCRQPLDDRGVVWSGERWRLKTESQSRLPVQLWLEPLQHCDLATVPDDLAAEMGRLVVAVVAAVEELPSVGRAHLARWGDGGAHLHLFVLGRPARVLQMRGSPLLDWEENLPVLPDQVHGVNAAFVAKRLVARVGGRLVHGD